MIQLSLCICVFKFLTYDLIQSILGTLHVMAAFGASFQI